MIWERERICERFGGRRERERDSEKTSSGAEPEQNRRGSEKRGFRCQTAGNAIHMPAYSRTVETDCQIVPYGERKAL